MISTAFVKIWGETVGAVAWDESSGLGSFEFEPEFAELAIDLAPIKMPIAKARRIYSFPELRTSRTSEFDTFMGLPGTTC